MIDVADFEVEDSSPDSAEIFDSALLGAAIDFDSSLKTKFDPTQYKKLRTVGAFIMRGLALDECCVLARIDPSNMTSLMQNNEDVAAFIRFKQVSYKASIMQTVAIAATQGLNVKAAGYMLENQFRNEFGKRNKNEAAERPPDMIERAIEFIRENGDSDSMVKKMKTLPAATFRVIDS